MTIVIHDTLDAALVLTTVRTSCLLTCRPAEALSYRGNGIMSIMFQTNDFHYRAKLKIPDLPNLSCAFKTKRPPFLNKTLKTITFLKLMN